RAGSFTRRIHTTWRLPRLQWRSWWDLSDSWWLSREWSRSPGAPALSGDMDLPVRIKVGIAAAAALFLWGAIAYFGFESEYQKQSRDPYQIGSQTARLAGIRAALPETADLGYVTDLEPGSIAATTAFNAALYALSPRLLRKDAAGPQVLGNFSHPIDYAGFGVTRGLRVERDFGSGVILYRREKAQ